MTNIPATGLSASKALLYDDVVAKHGTAAAARVSWLKLARAADAAGRLKTGIPSGGVSHTGAALPSKSAGPSASFDGTGHIAFAHNAALELAQGTLVAFVQPAPGGLAGGEASSRGGGRWATTPTSAFSGGATCPG